MTKLKELLAQPKTKSFLDKVRQTDGRVSTEKTKQILGDIIGEIKGEKGDSPTDAEIVALIKPLIPRPVSGRSPMHTGELPPNNPQKGDLWYQD